MSIVSRSIHSYTVNFKLSGIFRLFKVDEIRLLLFQNITSRPNILINYTHIINWNFSVTFTNSLPNIVVNILG